MKIHRVKTSLTVKQEHAVEDRYFKGATALHYLRGCTLCAGGHARTWLALRGCGDSLTDIPEEEKVEGKDIGGVESPPGGVYSRTVNPRRLGSRL